MKAEVLYDPLTNTYCWKLWTGPDGIDEYCGIATSIGEAFEALIRAETINSLHYTA
jgi:hypothetical protein